MTGKELWYISQAHHNSRLSGDGPFTKEVHDTICRMTGAKKTLLTHSCTAALEMSAILADIRPGDEVILPSYTFVSTANAFVLRGATLVFVDIRQDTLNIDENQVEAAITERTKVIVAVHYAGVACEMDTLMAIAKRHGIIVVEDAAQGVGAWYKGRMLGSIAHFGCYSFHETKNITSGEGGALLINDEAFSERAEIIREKGTNRSKFFRGEVDKYSWVDIGSSFLPGEVTAAFLKAQLEEMAFINGLRIESWNYYHDLLENDENAGFLRRPVVPVDTVHNAHMYYVIVKNNAIRNELLDYLKNNRIGSVFHYVPLHSSEYGRKMGYNSYNLPVTDDLSSRLIRLPMFTGLTKNQIELVVAVLRSFFKEVF
jgi:dTDP-4-amino-4,6-dideoxygalactose transaminase